MQGDGAPDASPQPATERTLQSATGFDARRISIFAGTFLVSLALLAFEITTVRTISFTVGPSYIYVAIALAMLGLSGAGSLLSLFDLRALRISREKALFWICVAVAALLLHSHFVAAETKHELNAVLAEAGRNGGIHGVVRALFATGFFSAFSVGASLTAPYFLFGALLAYLFVTTDDRIYGRLYGADLIGAALGSVGAIVVMETTDYAVSVTVPAVAVMAAAAAYVWPASGRLAAAGLAGAGLLAALPAFDGYAARIEPAADPNFLVRDYEHVQEAEERWHAWNSYTRVGAIEYGPAGEPRRAMLSLSNGDGMVFIPPFAVPHERPWRHPPTVPALLLDPPRSALVMFAGVGADLMSLRENAGDGTTITGIELNSLLLPGAASLPKYGTLDFLATDGIDLQISEGRVFLERDTNRYDLVLLSWSGATASYYAGMLGGTTQFLFTYEGLSAIFDRLTPDGYAIILQVNKVNTLGALRRYLAERGLDGAERTAIILAEPGRELSAWDGPYDDNPLFVKPTGWTDAEVARIAQGAALEGMVVAYAPGLPSHPDFTVYRRILTADDPNSELAALSEETRLRFGVVTDDRPFYLDLFHTGKYVDADFWADLFGGRVTRADDAMQVIRLIFVGTISVFGIAIILGPLLFRRGPPRSAETAFHMVYFFCLGAGFMILEIILMQRASLLFGVPGLTIAIVLAGLILSTGIGSLSSDWTFARGLSFRSVAAIAAAYPLALALTLDGFMDAILGWPTMVKGVALVALIAPGGFFLGQLFPRGLALAQRTDPALVPWAWAINGALSTIAAGVAPLLAQAWGFRVLLFAAAALYAVILLLPPYARGPLSERPRQREATAV